MTTLGVDHYRDQYWNDLPEVHRHLCRRATGNGDVWWMDYFKTKYATPPRKRALIFGCGNGWVERDLFDRGVAERFDAFDASAHYLDQARSLREGRPIRYFQAGFDDFEPNATYDLIVNVAALHHVRYLYRFCGKLRRWLCQDGVLVGWDYVGPSRNQYSARQMRRMRDANSRLPARLRSTMPLRPRLHTMLAGDHTEAVHSAEILRAVGQHFHFREHRPLGGAVAYQILWNNIAGFAERKPDAMSALRELLAEDERATDSGDLPSLFAFFVCSPKQRPDAAAWLNRTLREPMREAFAEWSGGLYLAELPAYLRERMADTAAHRRRRR